MISWRLAPDARKKKPNHYLTFLLLRDDRAAAAIDTKQLLVVE
jgi:hypothetical protein